MKNSAAGVRNKILNSAKDYYLKLVFAKLMYFISGIIISKGTVFGRYYPFGMSFSAAVPGKNMASVVIGSIIGYLFPLHMGISVRYIAAVVAVAAIRWALGDFIKVRNNAFYSPAVVFVSSFITACAVHTAEGFDLSTISLGIFESLTAAGAAYFFERTFKILSSKKMYAVNQKEFACIAIAISVSLMSLSNICLGGVSLGRVISVVMILCGAYCAGIAGGGITGIASGVIFSLPSFGLTYISGSYAFGGMIAGLVTSFGKIGVCTAFLFASTLASFQSGDITKMVGGFYESIIAITVFLFLPASFFNKVKAMCPSFITNSDLKSDFSKNCLIQKLNFAAKSLSAVSKFTDTVSSKLQVRKEREIKDVCRNSVQSFCGLCRFNDLCWKKDYAGTKNNFDNIIDRVSAGKNVSKQDFSDDVLRRCVKIPSIIQTLTRDYQNALNDLKADSCLRELKKIVTQQFDGMGCLLNDISAELEFYEDFNDELPLKIKNWFNVKGISFNSVTCRKNELGKLIIEIQASDLNKRTLGEKGSAELSKICGRKLSMPVITDIDDVCQVRICERENFKVDAAFSQHACNGAKLCGDSCCFFEDGTGKFNVIISDGMGTGGNAAVEGAMTSELMSDLMKSGIGFGGAVKMVNSALLLKSRDESLATLDVMSLNLYSGEAVFTKAGAPTTFIVKKDEVIKIDFSSLPIGILSDVSYSFESLTLQEGDWILMLSDGATDIGEDWITDILKSRTYSCANELAHLAVSSAINLRKEQGHDDDITAVAVGIFKNT